MMKTTMNKHLSLICYILSFVLLLSVCIYAEPSEEEPGTTSEAAVAVFDKSEYNVTIGSSVTVTVSCDKDDAEITFEIENGKIAKIDEGGVITGKKAGTTKINVLVNGVLQESSAKLTVSEAKLSVDKDTMLIFGFDIGESISDCQKDIAELFEIDSDLVNIYINDSLAQPTDKIATGMSIEFDSDTYYAVIRGDVNGDGEIDYNDTKAAISYLSGEEYIAGEAYKAACLIGDSEFNIECILRLSRSIEGNYTIEQ